MERTEDGMWVAVTGHRDLDGATVAKVRRAIERTLTTLGPVNGISCLADGADQIFAEEVLKAGGRIGTVIPARDYRDAFPAPNTFDHLLERSDWVQRLDYEAGSPEAYMDASLAMLAKADHVVAVWDGEKARGHGGTQDVVRAARDMGLSVTVVWPEGARRTPAT
ncbi:hypothetical protein [Salininema proteolyticum]|uniref:DUF2493 domain-containing protein n=1 Tax=Salininema proteolyticum TaxID=1607685 RepID=A0ABV8U0Q1_9ACTN